MVVGLSGDSLIINLSIYLFIIGRFENKSDEEVVFFVWDG
jgi:hypothetical protein